MPEVSSGRRFGCIPLLWPAYLPGALPCHCREVVEVRAPRQVAFRASFPLFLLSRAVAFFSEVLDGCKTQGSSAGAIH